MLDVLTDSAISATQGSSKPTTVLSGLGLAKS